MLLDFNKLGVWKWVLTGICTLMALFLMLPILFIVALSFGSSRWLIFPPPGWTLKWYAELFADPRRSLVRSGLVREQQLFSPEHLTEIYRCVQDTLVHLYNLTYDREKCLGKIQEQITNLVPDLQQRIAQAQPQEESAFTEPTM